VCTTLMNKIYQGNVGLIEWMKLWSLGSMGPPLHRSTTTTVIPRPFWVSLREEGSSHGIEVGRPHLEGWPHLPTTVPTEIDSSYLPSTTSEARIRSVQVKRRWIIGSAAPPHPVTPMKMGPRAQPTSLAYKRSLTPTRTDTQRWSISFQLFFYLE
jgi:hypothetical protein